MTNKTITLARDHVERLIDRLSKAQMFKEVTELRAALAEPVPPAGGEPEVLAWVTFEDGKQEVDWFPDVLACSPAGTELVDRAHVTQLQAEVERLNSELTLHHSRCGGAYSAVLKQNDTLQSELSKARELLSKAVEDAGGYLPDISEFLSNQSAPADKCISCDGTGVDLDGAVNPDGGPSDCLECGGRGSLPNRLASADKGQDEPKPTGLSQGWNLTRKHDGFVIGHQSRSPDTKAIEQAERGGYVWVPFLVPEQPAPVAVVLTDDQIFQAIRPALDKSDGGYICDTDKESAIKAGRAVVAALDEVARLNGVKP